MFPFIIFTALWGVALGSTLDQTVPEVHKFTAKHIIGKAESGEVPSGVEKR